MMYIYDLVIPLASTGKVFELTLELAELKLTDWILYCSWLVGWLVGRCRWWVTCAELEKKRQQPQSPIN